MFREFVFSVQQETQQTREANGVMRARGTLLLRNFPGWELWEQLEPDCHGGRHGHDDLHDDRRHVCSHHVPLMKIQVRATEIGILYVI